MEPNGGSGTDETESKLSEQSNRLMAVGMLVGPAFHEFNNLLTEVVGYAGLLKLRLSGDDSLMADLNCVCEGTARISMLLKRLRVLFRETAGEPDEVDPWSCVVRAVGYLPEADRARVSLAGCKEQAFVRVNGECLTVALHRMLRAVAAQSEPGSTMSLATEVMVITEQKCADLPYWVSNGRHFKLRLSFQGEGLVTIAKKALGGMYLTSTSEDYLREGLDILAAQGGLREYMGCLTVSSEAGGGVVDVLLPTDGAVV